MSRSIESLKLAERVADDLLRAVGESIPVDVGRVAEMVGVATVETAPMIEDGRTMWTPIGPVIQLNPARPKTRQRFTLAHEIAHVVLGPSSDPDRVVYRRAMCDSEIDEEHLCDAFAAALLMPRTWVNDQVRFWARPTFTLNLLRAMSGHAEVSISAAAARVTDVAGRLCAVIRWSKVGNEFVSTHRAALPVDLVGKRLRLGPTTSDYLVANRADGWIDGDIVADNTRLPARMQINRDRKGMTMLITAIGRRD
ncbi:MAG: ImmA/IrrE family metallo-endopeptidase [Actinomycetia bacterium]|nr:ImmA/IrrE family metallo-endopeptidase [Actinomycetes bacterium]